MNQKGLDAFYEQEEYLVATRRSIHNADVVAARQNAREAVYTGERVLKLADKDDPFISGTYVNMAVGKYYLYQLSEIDGTDYVKQACDLIEKALYVKPSNQQAIFLGLIIYSLLGEFDKASDIVKGLTKEGLEYFFLGDSMNNMSANLLKCTVPLLDKELVSVKMDRFCRTLEKKIEDYIVEKKSRMVMISFLLLMEAQFYYIKLGDSVKAYAVMKRVLIDRPERSAYVEIYTFMCTLCLDAFLNKKEEALKYGELAVRFMKKLPGNEKAGILSSYGLALYRNGDETGIEKCREAIGIHASDVTYYNYARALFEEKRYDEAFPWAKKALFNCDDEMNMLLVADVYKALKDYDNAIEYYRRAIRRLQEDYSLTTFVYSNEKNETVISYAAPDSLSFFLKHAMKEIIRIYIGIDLYKASLYLSIAEEFFPDDEAFVLFKETFDVIEASREEAKALEFELFSVKEEAKKQQQMSTELITKLINIQDESASLDLDNEQDWALFSAKVETIIHELETEAKENKKIMRRVKDRIIKQYPFLNSNALNFLVTAETLFEIHKGTEIDFACIIIEYVKTCECQLRDHLSQVLTNEKMLGDIIRLISERKIEPFCRHLSELNRIKKLRNRSAHTGLLTEKDVVTIRGIYFDGGFLQVLR